MCCSWGECFCGHSFNKLPTLAFLPESVACVAGCFLASCDTEQVIYTADMYAVAEKKKAISFQLDFKTYFARFLF